MVALHRRWLAPNRPPGPLNEQPSCLTIAPKGMGRHVAGAACAVLFCLVGSFVAGSPALADASCTFVLGFATMAQLVPQVGQCLENQHYAANGDAQQTTTGGLLVWRKADNFTAFTNGATTWVNGPEGIQSRPNDRRFCWEADVVPDPGKCGTPNRPPAPSWFTCWDVGEAVCIVADKGLGPAIGDILQFERGQWLLKVAGKARVEAGFRDLPVGVLGAYRPSTKEISLDMHLGRYGDYERAAVLVHELRHAAQDAAGQLTAARCYKNEFEAFEEEGYVWTALWGNSLPYPRNSLQAQLNDIARLAYTDPYGLIGRYLSRYGHECG